MSELAGRKVKEEFPMNVYDSVYPCQVLNKIPLITPKVNHKITNTSLGTSPHQITLYNTS